MRLGTLLQFVFTLWKEPQQHPSGLDLAASSVENLVKASSERILFSATLASTAIRI